MQVYCASTSKLGTITVSTEDPGTTQHLVALEKGRRSLSRETQPTIRLEVIVPHIALPMIHGDTKEMGGSSQQMEQVSLIPLADPVRSRSRSANEQKIQGIAQESFSSSTIQKRLFHLFRFGSVPIGQPLLLHILRPSPGKRREASHRAQGAQPPQRITDELVFRFEYIRIPLDNDAAASSKPVPPNRALLPGLTQVEMVLDAEGRPGNYSIDGVES